MNTERCNRGDPMLDVIVCGGGPVGLAMAYLLGREGVDTALFERRATTTMLPKGQYVHASTGELFRQWGVWDLLEDAGWETMRSNGQGFYVNVAKGPVAQIRAADTSHQDYVDKWSWYSPVYPRKVPASDYEAAIRRKAAEWDTVSLSFNSRIVDIEQGSDCVRVTVENTETGGRRSYRARYLVACDGAHSFIRSRVAQGQDHGPTFGNQILVEFRADLDETLGKDGFFHSFILHPSYMGWLGSKHPETGLWRYSFRHDEDTPPSEDVLLARLRGALGMPEIPLEIVASFRFDYSTGLLRRWREQRVLFAGDAAHWHSPWGGFGMNSGIQDANNLAWKLALCLREQASEALLDSYETERKSKALITVKSATYNSLHYQAIAEAVRVGEGDNFLHGELSEQGRLFLAQRVVPHGDNSVLHTGYQLGTVYESSAIVATPDTAPAPELAHYQETVSPGVRAPHAWLVDRQRQRISTVDLWGRGFVLLGDATPEYWHRAAHDAQQALGVAVRYVAVGEGQDYHAADGKFSSLYGRFPGELVLVRPDGYIAARIAAAENEAAAQLQSYLRQVLGLACLPVTAANPS